MPRLPSDMRLPLPHRQLASRPRAQKPNLELHHLSSAHHARPTRSVQHLLPSQPADIQQTPQIVPRMHTPDTNPQHSRSSSPTAATNRGYRTISPRLPLLPRREGSPFAGHSSRVSGSGKHRTGTHRPKHPCDSFVRAPSHHLPKKHIQSNIPSRGLGVQTTTSRPSTSSTARRHPRKPQTATFAPQKTIRPGKSSQRPSSPLRRMLSTSPATV